MFKTKAMLKIHTASHSDVRPLRCDQCEVAFKTTITCWRILAFESSNVIIAAYLFNGTDSGDAYIDAQIVETISSSVGSECFRKYPILLMVKFWRCIEHVWKRNQFTFKIVPNRHNNPCQSQSLPILRFDYTILRLVSSVCQWHSGTCK